MGWFRAPKPVAPSGPPSGQGVTLFRSVPYLRRAMRKLPWSKKRAAANVQNEGEFLERLKRIVEKSRGAAQAGRINVIGLDRLREKFGERWDALHDRVQSVARSAMQKYLQPEDIWVASGDKFVIAFGSLGFEDAQTKCRMIARMIETALLGDASTETISVATAVTTVDGKVQLRDLPSLEAMIAGAAVTAVGPRRREPAAPKPGFSLPMVAMPTAKRAQAAELIMLEDPVPAGGRVDWEPVWDARLQRVTMYRARYVHDTASASEDARTDEEDRSQIDTVVRDAVIEQLKECLAQSRLIALLLPVRFWTIASWARRRDYLARLSEQITPERRKLLLICLSELPEGAPSARLAELVATLRPFCREVIVESSVHMSDFVGARAARAFAVAADTSSGGLSERHLLTKLDQFAGLANKAGMTNCYLGAVRTMPVVTAAVAAGFRYLSGSAIGPAVSCTPASHPLTLMELYRHNLGVDDATEPAMTGRNDYQAVCA